MIMCIDIGNTNISFLLSNILLQDENNSSTELAKKLNQKQLRFNISTNRNATEDEYFFKIISVLQYNKISVDGIIKIAVCSVVPQLNFCFTRLCEKYFKLPILFLDNNNIPLLVNTTTPSEIGGDRLVDGYGCSLLAQTKKYEKSLLIDFGTATTFNLTIYNAAANKWQYEGGVICPGINLSLESLKNATAKLPRVSFVECTNILAKNTTDAINSGMFFGYKSLVEGIIEEFKKLHSEIYIVATGGLAELVCKNITQIHSIQKDLTLQTILKIALQVEK